MSKKMDEKQLEGFAGSLTEYTDEKLIKLFLGNGLAMLLVGRDSKWGQVHELVKGEMHRRNLNPEDYH